MHNDIQDVLVDKTIIRASVGEKWTTLYFTDGSRLEIECIIHLDNTFSCVDEPYSEIIVNFVESGNTEV